MRTENQPTKWEFFSRVWRQSEAEDRHGGDEETRDDEIIEIVHGPPPDLDGEGDVQVGLRAAVVHNLVPDGGDTCRHHAVSWSTRGNFHFKMSALYLLFVTFPRDLFH